MNPPLDLSGRKLGRFKVVSLIGRGGMGAVYRAHEASLGRDVALKVLPPELVSDRDRLQRFINEARTASSLNHPHVVSIYEIGEDQIHEGGQAFPVHYIAMELVGGETLGEKLSRGPIPLQNAIDYVAQAADAIGAAHQAGIVHRDLKPDNLIVTDDGFVKVLDFGIAKLVIRTETEEEPEQLSQTALQLTEPGIVLGTAGYMSPEQATSRPTDHRSDVFSLGCILYESVTGASPFRGESQIDTLHRIVHREPEPVEVLLPHAPRELQRILRKTLAKKRDDRYQSAKDLSIDLRDLSLELSTKPGPAAHRFFRRTVRRSGREFRLGLMAIGLLLLALIAGVAYLMTRAGKTAETAVTPSIAPVVTTVTSNGKVISGSVSPDGKYVAFVVFEQGQQSLWLRQLSTSQNLLLIPPSKVSYWGQTFSPDSTVIVYGLKSVEHPTGAFFQVSTLGGPSTLVTTGVDSAPAFSPTGSEITWVRADYPTPRDSALMVAKVDGSGVRTLFQWTEPDRVAPIFFTAPSWSSTGDRIVVSVSNSQLGTGRIVELDPASGRQRVVSDSGWRGLAQLAWLPDRDGILVIGQRDLQTSAQVWLLKYPGGEARPITNDLLEYRIISVTADGKKLVTVAAQSTSQISRLRRDQNGEVTKVTSGRVDGLLGVSFTPGGDMVYVSLDSGNPDVWRAASAGGPPVQITKGREEDRWPAVSRDGKLIAFVTGSPKRTLVEIMNADGTGRRVLTESTGARNLTMTPDQKSIVYESQRRLWKISTTGGTPAMLTSYFSKAPAVAEDGERVAFYCSPTPADPIKICVASINGGAPSLALPAPSPQNESAIRWAPGANSLLLNTAPDDRSNIWSQPLDGGKATKVTNFDEKIIFSFDVSRDGNTLAIARGDLLRDAVMISNFR